MDAKLKISKVQYENFETATELRVYFSRFWRMLSWFSAPMRAPSFIECFDQSAEIPILNEMIVHDAGI